MEMISRRSVLRNAAALPVMAVPAALAVHVLTPQERVEQAFKHLADAVKELGSAYVDHVASNKVGDTTVWLVVAKDKPTDQVRYFVDDGAPLLAADVRRY